MESTIRYEAGHNSPCGVSIIRLDRGFILISNAPPCPPRRVRVIHHHRVTRFQPSDGCIWSGLKLVISNTSNAQGVPSGFSPTYFDADPRSVSMKAILPRLPIVRKSQGCVSLSRPARSIDGHAQFLSPCCLLNIFLLMSNKSVL